MREIPRSGTPEELIDHFGISARAIAEASTGDDQRVRVFSLFHPLDEILDRFYSS